MLNALMDLWQEGVIIDVITKFGLFSLTAFTHR